MRTLQRTIRELWTQRTSVGLRVLLEGVGVAALFISAMLVDAAILRPLPFPRAGDVVQVWHQQRERGWTTIFLNRAEADFYHARSTLLESMVTYAVSDVVVTDQGRTQSTRAVAVVGNMCELLGVAPLAGRCLGAADAAPDAQPATVVRASEALARYHQIPRAVGASVQIGDRFYNIVGVVPDSVQLRHFSSHFYGPVDYMVPLAPASTQASLPARRLMLMGRLKPGTTFTAAAAELDALSRAYGAGLPDQNDKQVAHVRTLYEETVEYASSQAGAIGIGAALLAMLVAFNSILLRAAEAARKRGVQEIKVALGASSRRLLVEELVGSLVTTLATTVIAWTVAQTLLTQFERLEPWGLPALHQESAWAVFALAVVLICGASAIGGLVFVVRVLRSSASAGASSRRSVGASRSEARTARTMVLAQCAMATILVGATFLLLRTMWNLAHVDVGMQTERLSTLLTPLPTRLAETPEQRRTVLNQLLAPGTQPPSIQALSLISDLPLSRRGRSRQVEVMGSAGAEGKGVSVDYRIVAHNYFDVAGVRRVAGRTFDGPQAPEAAQYVVNQTFARRYLSGRDPVGAPIRIPAELGAADGGTASAGTIVGVVGDVRHWGPDRIVPAEIYVSYQLDPPTRLNLVFRTRGSPELATEQLHERLRTFAPELAAFPVKSMAALAHDAVNVQRFAASLFGLFAIAATIVTALGIYGLVSGYVSSRRAELAVRLSFGAGPRDVAALVARQALAPAILGCLAGAVGTVAAARALRSTLYQTSAVDPGILTLVPLCMITVTIVAIAAPVMAALRVQATELLRG